MRCAAQFAGAESVRRRMRPQQDGSLSTAWTTTTNPAVVGAGLRAAEPADLCAHRRGAGGGRLHVLAGDPRYGGCGCAGSRWRSSSRAGITDMLDGYFARTWGQQSSFGRMLDPIADKLLVVVLPADAGGRRHHPRLVAVGGDHHPVPRDPGLGPARISRRAARQRAGDAARQMEDDAAAGRDRLPASPARRATRSLPVRDRRSASSLLWLSALLTLYTGWDYFRAGVRHLIEELSRREAALYFAWVRERIGKPEEEIDPPAERRAPSAT